MEDSGICGFLMLTVLTYRKAWDTSAALRDSKFGELQLLGLFSGVARKLSSFSLLASGLEAISQEGWNS